VGPENPHPGGGGGARIPQTPNPKPQTPNP